MSIGRKAPKNSELGRPSVIYEGVKAGLLDPINLDRLEGDPITPSPDIYPNNLVILPSLRAPNDFPEGQKIWLHREKYNPCVNRATVIKQITEVNHLHVSGISKIQFDITELSNYGLWREEDIVAMAAFKRRSARAYRGVAYYLKTGETSVNPRANTSIIDNINRQLILEVERRLDRG